MVTEGNKSCMRAENSGKSSFRNLGTFESLIALISTISSSKSFYDLLSEPAMTRTDLTALIPKS
jgi:hypothetical protein